MDNEETYEEQTIILKVPPGYGNRERLDVYITAFVENASRSKVATAIKDGRVTVNGGKPKASYVIQGGDRVECRIRRLKSTEMLSEAIPLDIIYEDEALLIVDKPAGMVVHPAYGHRSGTLVNALLHHVGYSERNGEIGLSNVSAGPRFDGDPTLRPGLVHRIDKDTSGSLVVAKTDVAHQRLARQLTERTMVRKYTAILLGSPETADGRIETRLGRDPRDRRKVSVVEDPLGKCAVTNFHVEEAFHHASVVEFRLETGRTHQIRVHASHIGCPVMGDHTYDGRRLGRWSKGTQGRLLLEGCLRKLNRQALHARSIGFLHPISGRFMHFESPLPADMIDVVDRLRSHYS